MADVVIPHKSSETSVLQLLHVSEVVVSRTEEAFLSRTEEAFCFPGAIRHFDLTVVYKVLDVVIARRPLFSLHP